MFRNVLALLGSVIAIAVVAVAVALLPGCGSGPDATAGDAVAECRATCAALHNSDAGPGLDDCEAMCKGLAAPAPRVADGKSDAWRKANSLPAKAKAAAGKWTGSGPKGAITKTFTGSWLGWIVLALILVVAAFVIHRRGLWGETGRGAGYLVGIPAATFLGLMLSSALSGVPVSAWPGDFAPAFWLILLGWAFAEFSPFVVDDIIYIAILFGIAVVMTIVLTVAGWVAGIPVLNLVPEILDWAGGPAWWYWAVATTALVLHFFPRIFAGRSGLMVGCYIAVWLVVGSLSTN